MFYQKEESGAAKGVETIIGQSVKVKGDFVSQGNIVVEGAVEGSLKTSNTLLIGEKARVSASVEAKDAQINGEVSGNVKIKNHLEVGATAKISGDVSAGSISVSKGAALNGKYSMATGIESLPEKDFKKEDKKTEK